MKLISFRHQTQKSWGILQDDEIIDLGSASEQFDLGETLRNNKLAEVVKLAGLESTPRIPASSVETLLPIQNPQKILCVGLNYGGHISETGRVQSENPVIFTRFVDSLVADGAEIIAPRESIQLDYEVELAVIIGKTARRVSEAKALDYVLGYSIFNDGSVRDYQYHTHQFTPGKNFPASGSFGPYIVTKDEFGPIKNQRIASWVNGELVQNASLKELVFTVPKLISYISSWTTLQPGDIIATGTPEGVGKFRSPQLWLFPNDQIEFEIQGIGTLTNRISEDQV